MIKYPYYFYKEKNNKTQKEKAAQKSLKTTKTQNIFIPLHDTIKPRENQVKSP